MDLRSVPKRPLHLGEELRCALFVVKIEAGNSQVITVRECGVECNGRLQLFSRVLGLIELQERSPQDLVRLRETLAVLRIPADVLGRECSGVSKIAHRESCLRVIQKQRGRIGFESQSLVEERSGLRVVRYENIPDRELTQCTGKESTILLSCFGKFACPL